jgi:hypothetical protein
MGELVHRSKETLCDDLVSAGEECGRQIKPKSSAQPWFFAICLCV